MYTLAELIDIAETNNPETKVAWQRARARAAEVGITQADLYPTLAASAIAQSVRTNIFFYPSYYRQTAERFSPLLSLDYLIFDFGRREERIAISRDNLLAANFLFNDAHRRVIYQVMAAYYRLLNSTGQQEAAEATLKNAQTVQQAAEARLRAGLSTLPDVLEARSASAQADYDLQATIGNTEIAHGDLASSMGISPLEAFQVESIRSLHIPDELSETIETSIDKALTQRPDLMQRVQAVRAAQSSIKLAERDYLPTLKIGGTAGLNKTYNQQNQLPGLYSPNQETWSARLSLTWNIFDGFARENRLSRAKAEKEQAVADQKALQDQIENQVWASYASARTALRQQKAAAALLASSTESYNAAFQSYTYGLRSQIDVVSAQRTLALARTAEVNARTQLLLSVATLAYQTGNLLYAKAP